MAGMGEIAAPNFPPAQDSTAARDATTASTPLEDSSPMVVDEFYHHSIKMQELFRERHAKLYTPTATSSARARKVFAIPELLENILGRLPPTKIITTQRVCRQFQDVIETSVMVREKLLLRVHGKGTFTSKIPPHSSKDPALATQSLHIGSSGSNLPLLPTDYVIATSLNQLFYADPSYKQTCIVNDANGVPIPPPVSARHSTVQPGPPVCFAMEEVLRGRPVPPILTIMHLTNETTTKLRVTFDWTMGDKSGATEFSLQNSDGCIVGAILEAGRDAIPRKPLHSERQQSNDVTTIGQMAQEAKDEEPLQVWDVSIVLQGMILPTSDAQRATGYLQQ